VRGLLIRVFDFASRQLRRAASLLAMGVLGAMRRAELRQAIANGWERYGKGEGVQPILAEWEEQFYGTQLEPASRVLLVGCGTGRDLIALSQKGHSVDGLDIAREALEVCRAEVAKRGLEARLYDGAVEQARFEQLYDAVVFSWFAYGYIPGAAARIQTLQTLGGILRPHGRILFTYTLRAVGASRIPAAFARVVARLTRSDWTPQLGDLVELLRSRSGPALHFEHSFSPAEVVGEAQAAGLRVLWHEQAREGRVVLVAV
jgi:SAM-dependent methyltransferase